MYYAIDFDTRTVESKSEDGEDLAAYVLDNDLSQAIALVDSEDELALSFSLSELANLYSNITMDEINTSFASEDRVAAMVWEALEEASSDFPKFTKALGKKLLNQAPKPSVSTPKAKTDIKPKAVKNSAPQARVKLNNDDTLTVLDGKCKKGSILDTIVTAIDDDLCESVGEVLDYITSNHVIPKTGELADMKFAEHNVKYFIKQGKLSAEEGL